ncbi:Uma2 family endonuclease [Streptomyces sp. NPDC055186]
MDVFDGDYPRADNAWDELVWIWRHTDAPKPCKVEIIDGLVTVAPFAGNAHQALAARVQRRLYEVIPQDWGVHQWLGTATPSRLGLYIPDLAVVPRMELREGDDDFVSASTAELVVEITSPATAHHDRTAKAAGYAAAGVPLYLLIDGLAPGGPVVTLYGEPGDGAYRALCVRGWGESVTLPHPFDLVLDADAFSPGRSGLTPAAPPPPPVPVPPAGSTPGWPPGPGSRRRGSCSRT